MPELHSWATGTDTERLITVEDARGAMASLLSANGIIGVHSGFLATTGNPGQVTASGTADANVHVGTFRIVLPNPRGVHPYVCTMDTSKTVDVLVANPADPANIRHDLIIAQQNDPFYGDANGLFEVKRITGTPAASPSDPVVPGSPAYMLLARIRVAAGATAITSAMIDDLRSTSLRVVARGGVIPCTSTTRPASPYAGMTIFETDTGLMRVRSASAVWEEVYSSVSSAMTTGLPIRTTATGEASLTSSTHGFQIGNTSSANLRADTNEIQAVNNAASATLNLQPAGGLVQIGSGGLDCDGASNFDDVLSITPTAGANAQAIAFNHGYSVWADNIAVDGGAGSRLWVDTPNGGDVIIGPRTGTDLIGQLRLRTGATTAGAANMHISVSSYQIFRSTSSLKYKVDVQDLGIDLAAVRQLRPVRFRDRGEVEQDPDTTQTYIGLIAEEVDALGLTEFVSYMEDEDGVRTPDGVQYDRITVAALMLIGELEDTVAAQADQIADLIARVDALENPA